MDGAGAEFLRLLGKRRKDCWLYTEERRAAGAVFTRPEDTVVVVWSKSKRES